MFSLADSNFYYLSFFMNTGPVPAVSNVSTDVDMGIREIQELLQEESKAELEFQVFM